MSNSDESCVKNIYEYEPLPTTKHIRLVRILPFQPAQPLKIELITSTVEAAPPYYGLTYCWGESGTWIDIEVNGQHASVSENLYQALVRIQELHDGTRIVLDYTLDGVPTEFEDVSTDLIWIDQICVNQQDLEERGHQVGNMNNIYSHAIRAVIWLGEEAEKQITEEKFKYFQQLNTAVAKWGAGPVVSHLTGSEKSSRLKEMKEVNGIALPTPSEPTAYDNLYYVLEKPWFRRVWTIQEAVLPYRNPVLVCGPCRLEWFVLWYAARLSLVIVGFNTTATHDVLSIHHLRELRMAETTDNGWIGRQRLHGGFSSLELLLCEFAWEREASDPRDKVHALLGLADPNEIAQLQIVPDYTSNSLTLYRDTIRSIIQHNGSTFLLDQGPPFHGRCCGPVECEALLTWVPRWAEERRLGEGRKGIGMTYGARYSRLGSIYMRTCPFTSLGLPAVLDSHTDPNILRIRGIHVGSVGWTSDAVDQSADSEQNSVLDLWKEIMARLGINHNFEPKHMNVARKFADTWVGSRFVSGLDPPEDEDTFGYKRLLEYQGLREKFLGYLCEELCECYKARGYTIAGEGFSEGTWAEYQRLAVQMPDQFRRKPGLYVQKVFTTSEGDIGYGTNSMLPSDEIFILCGNPMCSVLRKCGDSYHYIGAACLPSFLDGHAVKEWQSGRRKAQWINIM